MMMILLLPHRLLNLVSLFAQQQVSSSSRFLTVLIMKSSSSRDCCVSDGMHASCWIVVVVAHWEFLLFSKPQEFLFLFCSKAMLDCCSFCQSPVYCWWQKWRRLKFLSSSTCRFDLAPILVFCSIESSLSLAAAAAAAAVAHGWCSSLDGQKKSRK
jgi:hypothetical protein